MQKSAVPPRKAHPDSWATDSDGNPTTDPAAALNGFLQPVGGHKGYGLALVVDLIAGLLSGAGLSDPCQIMGGHTGRATELGHYFLLIDVGKLGAPDWLETRVR